MRVLHVYKDYHPVLGGIENHVRLLAEEQARRGLDVTVLVTSPTPRTSVREEGGVRVIRAGRLAHLASTPISFAFFARMHRLRAEVVHLHFPHPPGEVGNLLLRPGRATVISYHSDVVRQRLILRLYRPLLRRVLRGAEEILVTSTRFAESSPFLRPLAARCRVVPMGIDVERFAGGGELPPAAARDGDPAEGRPLLLFVGRLRYYKGLDHLLRALREVDADLWVIGSGPMSAEWRALARTAGVDSRVSFLGDVSDEELPARYRAADLVVLPSAQRAESFGVVQLEAMAAGKPVVSTELGTSTSVVNQDEVTGLVVPPRDSRALAAAIRRLLADPQLRREMGERGRRRVKDLFSVGSMVDGVLDAYHSALEAASARSP